MANQLQLKFAGTIKLDGAEISDFDPKTKRLFTTGELAGKPVLQVTDISDPTKPIKIGNIDLSSFGAGVQSVAVRKGTGTTNSIVAIAVSAAIPTDPGKVVFFDAAVSIANPTALSQVTVGALPDMLTFTPDGTKVLVANEGEPNESYTVDPEGSISIIDVSGSIAALDNTKVTTATFTAFNGQAATLRQQGVRIFGKLANGTASTVAQDLEPEYIAVSPDGKRAFVTLQENNAVAVLDIATSTILSVLPLGFKDHSLAGNGFDASDRDNIAGNIKTYPVFGMYQPDAISSFQVAGKTYYITANEGDSRIRPTADGVLPAPNNTEGRIFNEEVRIGNSAVVLDPTVFPDAATLKNNANLGRLKITNTRGDIDGDGDYDQLYSFGARSFSIWDDTGKLVFDSGDQLEQITKTQTPPLFNANNGSAAEVDTRSDDKGPEPEAATIGYINGKPYAFIGLERAGGGIVAYDVSNPASPQFIQYIRTEGDISPEGVKFIAAADSPNAQPLLAVSNEVSNTVTLYQIDAPFQLQILHASDFEAGIPALDDAVRFSAVINRLRTDPNLPSNVIANTLTLSSGDNYIPGAFLNASSDTSLNGVGGLTTSTAPVIGRGDIGILNAIGIQASALGNHEFDLGVRQVRDILRTGSGNPGTNFPYLSTNLNFQPEITAGNLATSDLATNQTTAEANTIKGKLAKSTVITLPGNDGIAGTADDQKIGIVGATTPTLPNISSPGSIIVTPTNPTDYVALAGEIQTTVDVLKAQGINKIILLAHMQQLNIERDELAPRLKDVDIIIAGGSHTLLSDANDPLRAGDSTKGNYPVVKTAADGKPVLVVNTDANYKYVGRLVTEFDKDGVLDVSKLNNSINGAYAADEAGVDRVYGSDVNPRNVANPNVVAITDGLRNVISTKDNVITGKASVFLNGSREDVRTQETNFGNFSADANLWQARQIDPTVVISLKNGGGIRDNIGVIEAAPGATDSSNVRKLPTQPSSLAPNKQTGDVSQLDIENSLRFNNDLSLITVTAEQLRLVMEHAVAGTAPGTTPGQFPQVGGLSFSFDPTKTAIAFSTTTGTVTRQGDRVRNLSVLNEDGSLRDIVMQDGKLVGNANRTFRMVTLNFLAGTSGTNLLGGDNYPFPKFVRDNATIANRLDLRGETIDVNGNGRIDPALALAAGKFTFAAAGSEQDAFAEYLTSNFATSAFNATDVAPSLDTRIQRLDARQDGVFTRASVESTSTGVIGFKGGTAINQLLFTVSTTNSSAPVNELVVFEVDNPSQFNLKTALETGKAKVITSVVSNKPTGYNGDVPRTLGFAPNAKLGFALIKNGTADQIVAGQNKEVILSTANNFISNVTANGFDLAIEGLNVKVATDTSIRPLGTGLQSGDQGELIDLRGITGKVEATFTMNREAAFNNQVYFYKVSNADGLIGNLNPDTTNSSVYLDAALKNLVTGADGKAVKLEVANQATSTVKAIIDAGSILAPMFVANGTIEQLTDAIPNNNPAVFFPYLGVNFNKVDHMRLLGNNTFGFEDIAGGGDLDYNDVIVKVSLAPVV